MNASTRRIPVLALAVAGLAALGASIPRSAATWTLWQATTIAAGNWAEPKPRGGDRLADTANGSEQRNNDRFTDAQGGPEQRNNDRFTDAQGGPEQRNNDRFANAQGGPEQRNNDRFTDTQGGGEVHHNGMFVDVPSRGEHRHDDTALLDAEPSGAANTRIG